MKKLLSLIMLLGMFTYVSAQKITISNVDNTAYPKINVSVTLQDKGEAQQSDFKVYEKDKEEAFTFAKENNTSGGGGRNICFLIEASGYTHGAAIDQFKTAVISALGTITENDKVNVCYFGKANSDGKTLNVLSAEFTNDKGILKDEVQNKIVAARDTNRVADVFKGIYECLDFFNSKKDLTGNKILIVISAAINNSKSPIKAEDCIEKSTKFNIPIYTITYRTNNKYAADNFIRLSDKTNGKSSSAKSASEISSDITDFMGAAEKAVAATGTGYTLTFDATQSGETNSFDVLYKGEKVSGTYTVPEGQESVLKKYWWMLLIIGVVVIGIVVVIILMMNKGKKAKAEERNRLKNLEERNIQLQEQMRQGVNQRTQVPPSPEAQKFDLKRTIIGGGGGTPTLMVSSGTFSKNFPINKMNMTIGRNAGNDVVIPETTVSGNHASLVNEGGNWFIVDNNSTNGTFVNGTKVSKQKLNNNDLIKLGAANLKVQF